MSGSRNEPPISISSPRETTASLPDAEGVEDEQHGGGIVVDDGRVLGAGQLADQAAHVIVALAARRPADVELERHGRTHGIDRGRNRAFRQDGTAEVGVQHRAGEVEHAAQARHVLLLQQAERAGGDHVGVGCGSAAPSRIACRSAATVLRTALTAASWPKRLAAIVPAAVRST